MLQTKIKTRKTDEDICTCFVLLNTMSVFQWKIFKQHIEKKYQHWDPLFERREANQEPHKNRQLICAGINK